MSRVVDPSKSGKRGTMGVLGRLEHLSNLAHAVERRGRSDGLVQEIAEALVASGEYVTRMDVLRAQQAVDFNWAAHQAGRILGIRVEVEVQVFKSASDGRAQVRVSRQPAPA